MTTKLCCNVKALITCQLCNTRWCRECWASPLPGEAHYTPRTLYFCPKHPDKDVAILNGEGEDHLTSEKWTSNNFCIIPHRVGLVSSPRRDF